MSLPKHHERSSLMRNIKIIKQHFQHFHNSFIISIVKMNTRLCRPTEQTRGCRHGDGMCQKPARSINVDLSMASCSSNWNNSQCHRLLMTWSRLSTHDVHLDEFSFRCMRISKCAKCSRASRFFVLVNPWWGTGLAHEASGKTSSLFINPLESFGIWNTPWRDEISK